MDSDVSAMGKSPKLSRLSAAGYVRKAQSSRRCYYERIQWVEQFENLESHR
jgi:hypothetical protein